MPDPHIVPIGITGTRKGATPDQLWILETLLVALGATHLHHGDCVGVDAQAHAIATTLGLITVAHPPVDTALQAHTVNTITLAPLPFLERNRRIVFETVALIALPKELNEVVRSGTWATVRHAARVRRQRYVIFPDGTLDSAPHSCVQHEVTDAFWMRKAGGEPTVQVPGEGWVKL